MTQTVAETTPAPVTGAWAATTRTLRAFVARRVRPDDVDDVTQDILVRILRSQTKGRAAPATPAWLFTVARNAIIDHYRTRRDHGSLPPDLDQLPDDPDDGDPPPGLVEAARCLRPAVATLAEPYRNALTLVDLDGMTQTAAAAHVGISIPGMKSRVQRGRRILAERLRDWCSVYVDDSGQIAKNDCACACDPAC